MGSCETCRWWDRTDTAEDRGGDTTQHRCARVTHLYMPEKDMRPSDDRSAETFSPVDVPREAFLMDASGYHADLWTAPTFGCALHESEERHG